MGYSYLLFLKKILIVNYSFLFSLGYRSSIPFLLDIIIFNGYG